MQWAILPALLLVAVFALTNPYNKYLEIFFYFYASIWNTITIFQAITFGTPFDAPSLYITLFTTKEEAHGFLSFFLDIKIISFMFLIWLLPIILLFLANKYKYLFKNKEKFTLVLVSTLFLLIPVHSTKNIIQGISSFNNIKLSNIERNFRKIFWVHNATLIPKVIKINSFENNIPHSISTTITGKQNVVLFLSESSNRNQYSIYGYPRQTNQELEKLNIIKYDDVISSKAVTWTSIPLMLTFANLSNPENNITTIHDLFKGAGFKTYSFNGFSTLNKNDLSFSIQNRADTLTLGDKRLDAGIVNDALEILKNTKDEKNFILIFTAAAHLPFNTFYPEDIDEFTDTPPNIFAGADHKKRNEYDTAIKYLDIIIANFIKEAQALENTIILYTSDHGLEVANHSTTFGHSSQSIFPSNYEIPFIVAMTDDYKKHIEHLVFDTSRPYQTDNIIHSIIDLAGLKTNLHKPELSIFNKDFKEQKRYIHEEEYEIVRKRYTKAQ